MLGVAKSFSSVLSGEMRDTAELAPFLNAFRQRFAFSHREVTWLMRSFRSIAQMLPKGGDAIWSDSIDAIDDPFLTVQTRWPGPQQLWQERYSTEPSSSNSTLPFTVEGALHLLQRLEPDFSTWAHSYYDVGPMKSSMCPKQLGMECHLELLDLTHEHLERIRRKTGASLQEWRRWSNPLLSPLPHAPNMSIYSLYGIGKAAEAGYHYHDIDVETATEDVAREVVAAELSGEIHDEMMSSEPVEQLLNPLLGIELAPQLRRVLETMTNATAAYISNPDFESLFADPVPDQAVQRGLLSSYQHSGLMSRISHVTQPALVIDASVSSSQTSHGIKLSDGDGTVPLISLGFMCHSGWRVQPLRDSDSVFGAQLNPGLSRVVCREYQESAPIMSLVRSTTSADHVDIIGNHELISDIIKIVSKSPDPTSTVDDRFISSLPELSDRAAKRLKL